MCHGKMESWRRLSFWDAPWPNHIRWIYGCVWLKRWTREQRDKRLQGASVSASVLLFAMAADRLDFTVVEAVNEVSRIEISASRWAENVLVSAELAAAVGMTVVSYRSVGTPCAVYARRAQSMGWSMGNGLLSAVALGTRVGSVTSWSGVNHT